MREYTQTYSEAGLAQSKLWKAGTLCYALQHISFISTDFAVPGLNRDFAHSREVIIPDSRMKSLFEDAVLPIHRQIHGLLKYNETLANARDLLLPRLMNGEIAV